MEALVPRTLLQPSGREGMIQLSDILLADPEEVSQAQYLAFARQTGRRYSLQNHATDLPAVGVNAFDAAAYCKYAGKRLPTVTDWDTMLLSKDPRMVRLNDGVSEWIDGRKVPNFLVAKNFPALLFPQADISEEWRKIHGEPASLAGQSLAPARFAAADIGFRCVASVP